MRCGHNSQCGASCVVRGKIFKSCVLVVGEKVLACVIAAVCLYCCRLLLLVLELPSSPWIVVYNSSDDNNNNTHNTHNTLMPFQMLKQAPASWSRPITPSRPVNLSNGVAPIPPSPPPPTRKGKDMKGCITVCSTGSRLFSTHAALRKSDIHNSTILTSTESRAAAGVTAGGRSGVRTSNKIPLPRALAKAIQDYTKPYFSRDTFAVLRISTAHRTTAEVGGCSHPSLVCRPSCFRPATVNRTCAH